MYDRWKMRRFLFAREFLGFRTLFLTARTDELGTFSIMTSANCLPTR